MSKDGEGAEESLFSGEQALRLLVETIPTLVWRAAPDGNIEYVNKRVLEYFGAPLAEITGWGWAERVHPDDVAFKVKSWLTNLETESPHHVVCRFRGADGDYRWFNVRGEPLRASDGTVLRWYGLLIDVDDQKRAEEALLESEHKLRQIIETVPSLLWSLGPEGEQTRLNQRALDYIGVQFEDLVRLGWQKFLHPDDLAETAKAFSHAIQTGTSYEAVHRIRRADGEYRWHHARGEPLRDQQGRIVQWYGLSVDIDEAKKAEGRLRRSEAYLAEAQRLSHSGVAAYNETKILYGSEEIYRIWGVDPAQGVPSLEAVIQQVHPDDRDRMRAQVQRAVDEKRDYSIAYRIVLPDETIKHLEAIGRPAFSASGELIEIVTTQIDVTERNRAEDQLRRSEALLAEAQRLSHSGASAYNETTILYFSEEAYRIWGFDPAQGIPAIEALTQRIHPDDRDRAHAQPMRAFREKRGYSHGYRLVMPDGTVKHLESIGEPVLSASGELVEIVATQIDVTERKRAEEALRESEHALRQIFETVPGLLWSTDPDGEPTQLNQRMLDYTGMRFEDFKNGGWEVFLHPGDLPETVRAFQYAIQTGTSYQAVHRLRRADGECRWHHTRGEPLRDRQGRIVQWYGLSVDIDEGKRAEELLRRSEAYLAEAQSLSHTGSAAYNETKILYWSGETYRIFGLDPRNGLPDREAVVQMTHPDDRERVRDEVGQAVQQKRDYKVEYRIVLPTGTIKYIETTAYPKFSGSGEFIEAVATLMDVTERKRAEAALRESEYKLRQIMDTVPGLTWSTGQPGFMAQVQAILNVLPAYTWYGTPSGSLTFVNTRQADFLGVPKDHPLRFGIDTGAPWDVHIPFLHPDDQEDGRKLWSNSLRTGEGYEHNYRVRTALGDYCWFHTRTEPLRASDGTLLLWVGATLDIEELKRAEEGLRESEAKFRDYAESASDWFWEIDPDYKFTLLTENAFGSDAAGRIGKACWDRALDLETEPEKWRLLWAALDARKPFRDFVYRVLAGDGSPMYVKSTGKPVFDADGEFRGYRGTGTDVTALIHAQEEHERVRRLESDLAHMNRLTMMGELAASLAHEITQPIAAARNNARAAMHFLDRNPPDLTEIREALASIVDDSDRAGDIIDRIRDHIKKAPARKARFDLNKAIDEVVGLARSAITANGVSVRTRFTEAQVPVEGDRVQLQQVLLNLILNAVEAMSTVEAGPRELSIATEQSGTGDVLVSVHDSGPGIDPDHLDHVFQAFYTTKSSGVGMGLSICRSIIDGHGGRLWAETNASRGAVFQFTLPGEGKELKGSALASRQTGEPHQDIVSDATHQTAYEGNKRPRRSERGRGQRRRGRQ